MPGEEEKRKPGRPRKRFARTSADFDEIIFGIANSMKQGVTHKGEMVEGTMFQLAIQNLSSQTHGVRRGAKEFVGIVQDAARREDDRQRRARNLNDGPRGI